MLLRGVFDAVNEPSSYQEPGKHVMQTRQACTEYQVTLFTASLSNKESLKIAEYIFVLFIKLLSLPRFPRRYFRREVMGGGEYTYIEKTFT